MSENEKRDINAGTIPKRILTSVINSLAAGVVPRSGAPYIAIGRRQEIEAMLSDLENVSEGGASIRFLIGRYGSGKSFLIQLIRGYALERGFITADCDLSPERRLYGTGGAGLATYRELIRNLASKASPDGGALKSIISRRLSEMQAELLAEGITPSSPDFTAKLGARIYSSSDDLRLCVGGFDFALVLTEYFGAAVSGDDMKTDACMRWLRGEYASKTEARAALGFPVSSVIDDENWYDYLKLWAVFSRRCGYCGLIVFIDECVNLYKITNRVSRENNYEKLLSMFNDTLGSRAEGLGLIFGGTPQFLEDPRRGLFGYEALRSRLCDPGFADGRYRSSRGPILRLVRLSDDELFALISRLSSLYAVYSGKPCTVSDAERAQFLSVCTSRAGAGELITPREIIRDWLYILDILSSNPDVSFADIIGSIGKQANPDGKNEPGTADEKGRFSPSETRKSQVDPDDIEI